MESWKKQLEYSEGWEEINVDDLKDCFPLFCKLAVCWLSRSECALEKSEEQLSPALSSEVLFP